MLNVATPRSAVLLAAVGPTARVAHLGPAALTVGLAAVPVIVAMARGDAVSVPAVMAGLLVGATLAWAGEDQAADLMASFPLSSPVRTSLRLGLVALVAIIGAVFIAVVVAVGPGLPADLGDRLAETVATAAVAVAVGLVASRRGERGAGPVGVTALAAGPTHPRWWILALAGVAVAAHAGHDPGRW